jgi:hypothetical protein
MPRYEFYCKDCKRPFEILVTLEEYAQGKVSVRSVAVNTCSRRPPPSSP